MYKPFDEKLYKKLRLLLISFVLCIIEALLLNVLNYDNQNPFWNWGVWIVCGITITLFLNSLAKLVEIRCSFSTKAFRIIADLALIMGIYWASLALLK